MRGRRVPSMNTSATSMQTHPISDEVARASDTRANCGPSPIDCNGSGSAPSVRSLTGIGLNSIQLKLIGQKGLGRARDAMGLVVAARLSDKNDRPGLVGQQHAGRPRVLFQKLVNGPFRTGPVIGRVVVH